MAETLPLGAAVGALHVPASAHAIVVLARGDCTRNDIIVDALHDARFATLELDLESAGEPRITSTAVDWLAGRLLATATWLIERPELANLPVGIFGTEMAGGAALAAAAIRPDIVRALVLCDGLPFLPGSTLSEVHAPTLLIVDGQNEGSVAMGQETMTRVKGIAELETLQRSPLSHDDPETAAHVALLALRWFGRFLA